MSTKTDPSKAPSNASAPVTNAGSPGEEGGAKKGGKKSQKRMYRGERTVDHDLFRCKPAYMRKNTAIHPGQVQMEDTIHEHYFHTVDSNGVQLLDCNDVGGHTHQMKVTHSKDGVPEVECGPAGRYYVKKTANGGKVRVFKELEEDEHSHDMEYLRSDVVQIREINAEFLKFEAHAAAQKPQAIPGITG